MDGFAIGAGFQIGSATGVIVALAVVTHDFADGFNTVSITSLYGKQPQARAHDADLRRARPGRGAPR